MSQNMPQTVSKKRADMRDVGFDEIAIRSDQLTKRDVFIPNLELATFRDEFFRQKHEWAFSQIVRAGFETQSQHADLTFADRKNGFSGPVDMLAIAWKNRLQQRKSEIE